ncbi:MAG TPA: hypothetical protein VF738_06090 [Rhodanobacter sp.]
MHLEPPNSRLESFRDFARHYLMIVLSILTALGLEAWIEHVHHAHAAAVANAQIEAELGANLADIRKMRDADVQRLRALNQLDGYLIQAVKDGTDAATIRQHVDALTKGQIYLGLLLPEMRHEAWDVAVANQSASWIDAARLRDYSAVYAAQDAMTRLIMMDAPSIYDGPRMQDTLLDVRTGDYQPRDLLHVVNQMCAAASEATHGLQALAQRIHVAVPDLAQIAAR